MNRWAEELFKEQKVEWIAQGVAQGMKEGRKDATFP